MTVTHVEETLGEGFLINALPSIRCVEGDAQSTLIKLTQKEEEAMLKVTCLAVLALFVSYLTTESGR